MPRAFINLIPTKRVASFLVQSVILTSFENRMGLFLGKSLSEGWEILGLPVFTGYECPTGMNPAAVGNYPHFLVLLQKRSK